MATHVTDFTKSDVQILIDLVNAKTPNLALTPELVTFGLPTLNDANNRNTKVTITAVPGSGYTNFKALEYNRVDYAVIPGARSIEFPKGEALKIADMIAEINARYGLKISANDFVDGDLPEFAEGVPNQKLDFKLTASAESLIYRGTVTFKLINEDLDLAVIITDPVLDGLEYVQPVDPAP